MLNARNRTKRVGVTPTARSASTLPVRVIQAESRDFETEIRRAKQREQKELEMKQSISNDTNTGTTREQRHGNASYQEILDVADYEVQPPDSSPVSAKVFATSRPMGAQAPASATVSDGIIAVLMGNPEVKQK